MRRFHTGADPRSAPPPSANGGGWGGAPAYQPARSNGFGGGAPPASNGGGSGWSSAPAPSSGATAGWGSQVQRGSGFGSSGGGGPNYSREGYGTWTNGKHVPGPPSARLEKDLFGDAGDPSKQQTGINFDKYADIPVEATGEGVPEPITTFTEQYLDPHLLDNIRLAHYKTPTPVQKYSVPVVSMGRDLMACAQTGSGKTGGFLFPILSALFSRGPPPNPALGGGPQGGYGRGRKAYPVALILAPTRELVSQIHDEARKFAYRSWVKPAVVYGGAEMGAQLRQVESGCDILSATPGRLVDLMERGRISMENSESSLRRLR